MLSVISTTSTKLRSALVLVLCIFSLFSFAQINSPYSRYGLGDITPSGNVVTKGMGGISTPYGDYQSVNFLNPASYSRIGLTTFDVSLEIENRTLHNQAKTDKYSSANLTFNYLTVGLPLNKKGTWGMAFGLRPMTKINYKIESRDRLITQQTLNDSVMSIYEGSGGTYKGFIGTGAKFGGLSIGTNIGYQFGQEELSTRRIFVNDTVSYYKSNSANNVSFGSFFAETGLQYDGKIGKTTFFRLGATYALKSTLKGNKDVIRETFNYDQTSGAATRRDSVYEATGIAGDIKLPQSYSAGLVIGKTDTLTKTEKWMIGVQYDASKWSDYSFYGQKDQLANSYMVRIGGEITPNILSTNAAGRLTYRAGLYFGKDYVNAQNIQLPVYAVTFGLGIPVKRQSFYTRQYTTINLGIEVGKRGNSTTAVTENIFKFHIGLSLSDIWFQKRKYE
ncbi:MAG: hypothetical protein ABIX01_17095 [Chitinophagaceae bacterium]